MYYSGYENARTVCSGQEELVESCHELSCYEPSHFGGVPLNCSRGSVLSRHICITSGVSDSANDQAFE